MGIYQIIINVKYIDMKATDVQIGGSHYKDMAMQPIELITALRCSFIQGCIIKYISRHRAKNGAQDIKKCIHYAQLAIQLGDKRRCNDKTLSLSINMFIIKNKLTVLQRRIITQAAYNNYKQVIQLCKELLQIEYPEEQ